MLVQVGDLEVLLDEAKLFAELAKKASVDVTLQVWPGMPHDFQIFAPILSEGQDAIDKIGEFVLKHT
jgi:acetyl esterase/lipase